MVPVSAPFNLNTIYPSLPLLPERGYKGCVNYYNETYRRLTIRQYALDDVGFRVDIVAGCVESPLFWFDNFAVCLDPKHDLKRLPLVLLDSQRHLPLFFLAWSREYRNATNRPWSQALKKSREMGATWIACNTATYGFCFTEFFRAGFLTRSGTELDSKSVGSLFGKIQFQLDNLPLWLTPRYERNRSDHEFYNLDNQASIVGSKTVADAFRGDRQDVTFIDESASLPNADEVSASVDEVTECPVHISTPKGKGNRFAKICLGELFETHTPDEGDKLQEGIGFLIHTLHYSSRPDRDPETREGAEWIRNKRATTTAEQFAQEHDINFEVSQPGRILPDFSEATHVYRRAAKGESDSQDEWKATLRWLNLKCPVEPVYLEAWDFGLYTGPVHAFYVPPFKLNDRYGKARDYGDVLYLTDYQIWYDRAYDDVIREYAEAGYWTPDNTSGHRPQHRIGDVYGKGRGDASKKSWFDFFEESGMPIEGRSMSGKLEHCLNLFRIKVRDFQVRCGPKCSDVFDTNLPTLTLCLEQYARHPGTGKPDKSSPLSHLFDAALFLVDYVWNDQKIKMVTQNDQTRDRTKSRIV